MNFIYLIVIATISIVSSSVISSDDYSSLQLSTSKNLSSVVKQILEKITKEEIESIEPTTGFSVLHVVINPQIYKSL